VLKGAVARHYAQAVFELATDEGTIDRWHDDLKVIAEYLGNRRLAFVLKEPNIPAKRKELIVRDLLNGKVQQEALNLAQLLTERGLADLAPAIANVFEQLYNDYRGQAVAVVTTAIPLDDELRAHITDDLRQITGKRILLQERVDPSILGGAIARVGDTLIDGSLRRRFQLLRQQIVQGSFGGPEDGTDTALADLDGGGGPGDGASDGGAPASGGPTMATERTARPADQPHLGPKPPTTATDTDTDTGTARGTDRGTDRRSGRPNTNKRRRR
jgi:F-type H+-transporting ATPase subunit delta